MRASRFVLIGFAASCSNAASVTRACADLATAECALLNTCSATDLQQTYGTLQQCESRENSYCEKRASAPSSGFNPAHAEGCAAAYSSWSCRDFLDRANLPPACVIPKGGLATGQPCALGTQCETTFCAVAPGKNCGVCAAPPITGDSCANLNACAQESVCTTDTQKCVNDALLGQPCGIGAPCGGGAWCLGENTSTGAPGICSESVATLGAPCETSANEAGCNRDLGLSCNAVTKQCAPIITAGPGEPCNTVDNVTALCLAGATCSTVLPGATGTCVAAAADGAPCDLVNGPACQNLSLCVVSSGTSGICQLPDGSSCQ